MLGTRFLCLLHQSHVLAKASLAEQDIGKREVEGLSTQCARIKRQGLRERVYESARKGAGISTAKDEEKVRDARLIFTHLESRLKDFANQEVK